MSGAEIKARRHAREIVDDMHWRGIAVPPVYVRMAAEFQDLVRSGDYATWVAGNERGRTGTAEQGPGVGGAFGPT